MKIVSPRKGPVFVDSAAAAAAALAFSEAASPAPEPYLRALQDTAGTVAYPSGRRLLSPRPWHTDPAAAGPLHPA